MIKERFFLNGYLKHNHYPGYMKVTQNTFHKYRCFGSDGSEPLEEDSLKSLKQIKTDYQ